MAVGFGPKLQLEGGRELRSTTGAGLENSAVSVDELQALADIDDLAPAEEIEPLLFATKTLFTSSAPDDLRLPSPPHHLPTSEARYRAIKSFVRKFEARKEHSSTEEQRAGVLLGSIHDLETQIRALMIKSERA